MSSRLFLLGFSCSLSFTAVVSSDGECADLNGRTISQGLHYVPGPDTCTLCVCDSGQPKWCKAVLCSPPQDCKSFRLGNSCCDFICLDDTLTKSSPDGSGGDSSTDIGLRLLASAVTIILFLSLLFFLFHRLRQRKIRGRQNRQLSEDARSLGSIGYIAGSLAYLPGSLDRYEEPPSHFPLWKPPGSYFPRGEAPPPYEEAVAAARAEAALARGHRTIPLALRLDPPPPHTPAIRSDAFYEDVAPPAVPTATPTPSMPVLPPPASHSETPCATSTPPPPPTTETSASDLSLPAAADLGKPDDNDDYRSECENCKSTHGSRYYLDEEEVCGPSGETMTLQRRPQDHDDAPVFYRTSLTLPTHSRRLRSTPLHGTPAATLHSARENWFSSMPASSTSSSEEE